MYAIRSYYVLGEEGLRRVAAASHANTRALVERLTAIPGVERAFSRPVFHEAALRLPVPVKEVLRALAAQNLLGGYDLGTAYPELAQTLLVCATETKTAADLDAYAEHLGRIIAKRNPVKCPIQPKW